MNAGECKKRAPVSLGLSWNPASAGFLLFGVFGCWSRVAPSESAWPSCERERGMKALLVVGLLGVASPLNEAAGQSAACRNALAAHKDAVEAFIHATVALGPANLVRTCTALDALVKAGKRKDTTQKRVRSVCGAGAIRRDDTSQWRQVLEVEKTRIEECRVPTRKR